MIPLRSKHAEWNALHAERQALKSAISREINRHDKQIKQLRARVNGNTERFAEIMQQAREVTEEFQLMLKILRTKYCEAMAATVDEHGNRMPRQFTASQAARWIEDMLKGTK